MMREEKNAVLAELIPQRVLLDYQWMKSSECKTQTLAPQLKNRYQIDKVLYRLGSILLKLHKMCAH